MGHFWGSDVPLIGKSLAKFGKVGQMLASPCQPTPELWIKASWVGLAHAVWSLAKPSALSPHGSPVSESVFGGHSRTRPSKGNGMRYRWNGELIPGPEFQWPQGEGWAMWKIPFFLARQAGWYLLVFDATANGFLNWTSTAMKWAGCPVHGVPYGICKEAAHLILPHEVDVTGACSYFFKTDGLAFGGGGAIVPAGSTWTAMLSITSKPWSVLPNEYAPATGRIINETTGTIYQGSPPTPPKDGIQGSVAIARAAVAETGDEHIRFQVDGGGGYCDIVGSTTFIQVSPFDNLLADP
jgi:hypothetical protein